MAEHEDGNEETLYEAAMAEYRRHIVEAHHTATRDFDKLVVTLSGGALGLSITFIRNIAPNPQWPVLLGMAWAAYTLSLLMVLISLLTSQAALRLRVQDVDARRTPQELNRGLTTWTERLNRLAAVFLIGGTLMLVWFALVNLGG